MIGKVFLYVVIIGFWASAAQAVVVKELQFESEPPGAEVFLLQGTRQVPLGTTPLRYQAEFHSEVSILRFLLKKVGFEPQTIEASAKQDKVSIRFASRSFAAKPSTIEDPELRSLQERLAPIVDRTFSKIEPTKGQFAYEIRPQAKVVRFDGKIFLIVPVDLQGKEEYRSGGSDQENDKFLREIWDQVGKGILTPLAQGLYKEHASLSILLDVGYSGVQHGFSVGGRLETYQEMQCFPGMVQKEVWDPCATMVYDPRFLSERRCEQGFVTKMVYDPCATKAPVTRSQLKADPSATVQTAQLKAQYVIFPTLMKGLLERQDIYAKLGVLLTKEGGQTIFRRGEIPSTLPKKP